MRGQAIRARSQSGYRRDGLEAGAGFLVMAIASAALAILLFVRHAHTQPGGRGYWTDALGLQAGVDNIGVRTVFTIFSNADLHWQHNLLVLGALLGVLSGFVVFKRSGRRVQTPERCDA